MTAELSSQVAILSDGRFIELYHFERTGAKTKTTRLPFLLANAGELQRTAGLDLYVGLMYATTSTLGFNRAEAPQVPGSFKLAVESTQLSGIVRRGDGMRPDVLRLNDDSILKVYPHDQSFQNEVAVFQRLANGTAPILQMIRLDAINKWVHLRPYCRFTLADLNEFRPRLFKAICKSATALLRAMWAAELAYMDAKPANVLLTDLGDGALVYWNDFGLSAQLGLKMRVFQGTRDFASVRVNELDTLLMAQDTDRSIEYGKHDDAQSVFFTLLSCAFHRKGQLHPKKLPWQVDRDAGALAAHNELIYSRKKQWIEEPTITRDVPDEHARDLLSRAHKMLFQSSTFDDEAFLRLLDGR